MARHQPQRKPQVRVSWTSTSGISPASERSRDGVIRLHSRSSARVVHAYSRIETAETARIKKKKKMLSRGLRTAIYLVSRDGQSREMPSGQGYSNDRFRKNLELWRRPSGIIGNYRRSRGERAVSRCLACAQHNGRVLICFVVEPILEP